MLSVHKTPAVYLGRCVLPVLALLMIMVEPAAPAQTSDAVFYVATYVDVQLSSTKQSIALMAQYHEASRKDEGNVRYDVFQQNAPRTNHFTVFAAWKDQKAFDSHEVKPHTRQFREALGPMLGAPYDERLYMRNPAKAVFKYGN